MTFHIEYEMEAIDPARKYIELSFRRRPESSTSN